MEFLNDLAFWHWLVFGLVLLGIETLGIGGFLIGMATAALLQGAIVFFMQTMEWQMQTGIFGFDAVVFSFVYWKFFRNYNDSTDRPELNDRAGQMVGRVLTLEADIENGAGHVQFGDTRWKVKADKTLKLGTKVEVVSTEGMALVLAESPDTESGSE